MSPAYRTANVLHTSKSPYHFGNVHSSGFYIPSICSKLSLQSYPRLAILHQRNFSILSTMRLTNYPELLGKHTSLYQSRSITIMSKLGKRKTCKAVAKRFLRTGKGKLKRWRAGKNHLMMNKSNKRRKQLKKPTYVSKQQLKLLNKMLNGW